MGNCWRSPVVNHMGNCWRSPVVNHSPVSTKPFTPVDSHAEKSNDRGAENRATLPLPPAEGGGVAAVEVPPSGRIVAPNLKVYKYAELNYATKNFGPDTMLGGGGFGTVFKGWVNEKTYAPSRAGVGMPVAVWKSSLDSCQGLREWLAGVKFWGKFSHPNLVKLLGYCWEDRQFLLVCEYMQQGSLESHLFRKRAEALPWDTRLKIAVGAAQGLAFLHTTEKQVIYRDFKSSNILLDADFNAKLSDFGLAKSGPEDGDSHVTTGVVGRYGYAAPEYISTGHLNVKSDVYGFGVVLLEIIADQRVLDLERSSGRHNLIDWARPFLPDKKKLMKIMDPQLADQYPSKAAFQTAELILRCLESEPKNRPSMEEVLEDLQTIQAIKMNPKESKASTKHNQTTQRHQQSTGNYHHHHGHGHNRSPLQHKNDGGVATGGRARSPLPKRKEMYSDPKSRGEEDSERLQLQVHQYSDPTIGISDRGNTSGTASAVGVLSTEELVVLNEKGEVVTQGQNSSPEYEDEESLSEVAEEEILLKELEETPSYPGELEELNRDPMEKILLKELEETPSYPGESEELNRDPMEIPPTISHHFSILHVVDLSYTEINTLPRSISRLVALQKLYLRSCELLMELPPEIGELTNLEVLDLEGTEILCLPKEIAKLVKLTCLKVSFDGYANQTVIPRRVLSNLSRLKELIIDVSPYGEWWDVEVEAIIDDLRNLKELRSLKLYLPTAKLLEDLRLIFPELANFRFTVGRHEEHFISRLPHDVEEEFNNREKLEKGLRYINGSRIPNEVTKVFKHANAFFLRCHWTAESLSNFGNENMNEVKFCLVTECNEFRTIIDSEQCHQGKDDRSESQDFLDFDEAIILGSLQKMIIRYMKNMVSIWKGPVGKGSLSNLNYLALHTCPNLTTLFTIDMLNNLINLEELIVEDCPKIDSLVSLKNSNSKSDLFLPNLKKISLLELPELVSISSGLWIAPKLERMVIFYCPKLEKLSTVDVSSTNLKVIKGEKEWWDALKWYESDLSTKHEDYLARLFIPLRMDGDLMAQLTKD